MQKSPILIGIVDHLLYHQGLISLIEKFNYCQVILEAGSNSELQEKIKKEILPHLVLLNIEVDGYETLNWLQKFHPYIHVIILNMFNSEFAITRLLQSGAKAFLKKNISPEELKKAIHSVKETGFYYNNSVSRKLLNTLYNDGVRKQKFQDHSLSPEEIRLLQLTPTNLTYKEIANEMNISARRVDKIRDHLFFKFDVKNRVALAVKSMKDGVIV